MDKKGIEEWRDTMVSISYKIFADRGRLVPVALILTGTGDTEAIGSLFGNLDEKDKFAMKMCLTCKAMQAQALLFISESWIVEAAAAINCAPSQHPDRREVVMFNFETPTEQTAKVAKIVRPPDGKAYIEKAEWTTAMQYQGRFVNILYRGDKT